ncbi:GNAT family N-acetyltransferase [Litoribacter populi]|uniref:GNAT family N-acetyltransferase n=1 Tax=Litoribacter populi TaxID=2598460 RepID=UPI00117CBB65|nr:GNAT family N-acetyltransferase [Litoribacter populi]
MINKQFIIQVAKEEHLKYADTIVEEMANSAQARGTGIAKRSPEYIMQKMREGKAVIALSKTGEWAGFCYIEAWGHEKFVANSGLIVSPNFRKSGLAREIKNAIFKLSRKKYPTAKIFGLTTGAAVMKINSELGYYPVSYSDLTDDEQFWKGCQSCVNYAILTSKNRQNCLCTAMLYVPKNQRQPNRQKLRKDFYGNLNLFERWTKIKKSILVKFNKALKLDLQS